MEPAENRLDDDREIPEALCQTEAAMEPTGPGRTTPVIRTYLSNDYVPQWSRPGNGRMTGLPDTGEIFLNTPQWSRPGNGRTTNRLVAGLGVLLLAAMEPAEYRLGDLENVVRPARVHRAAMEPAENRPDNDAKKLAGFFKVPPQWSRPGAGQMTGVTLGAAVWQFQPQWSQPRMGWVTSGGTGQLAGIVAPQ